MISAAANLQRDLPNELRRRFDLVVFDWDGTAVPDRLTSVPQLNATLASLLEAGTWLAPVTGTSVEHLERQSINEIPPSARPRLRVCTNRGSEVWGYGEVGERIALFRRVATPAEEAMLTAAVEELQRRLAERNVESRIIYDRLNRRKLDLIPLPEWNDPPKARIRALIAATTRRLQAAGIERIGEVMRLATTIGRDCGLADPRVTSDGKYVEIGLTDKSDSITWLFDNVVRVHTIPTDAILIAGDEFGDIGGFPGSDERMTTRDALGARIVSVGREPRGVPPGVIHVRGGPDVFLRILQWQLALRTR